MWHCKSMLKISHLLRFRSVRAGRGQNGEDGGRERKPPAGGGVSPPASTGSGKIGLAVWVWWAFIQWQICFACPFQSVSVGLCQWVVSWFERCGTSNMCKTLFLVRQINLLPNVESRFIVFRLISKYEICLVGVETVIISWGFCVFIKMHQRRKCFLK